MDNAFLSDEEAEFFPPRRLALPGRSGRVNLVSTVVLIVIYVVVVWFASQASWVLMLAYDGCSAAPNPCSGAAGQVFVLGIPILGVATLLVIVVGVIRRLRRRVSTWWIPLLGLVLMVAVLVLDVIAVVLTDDP